MLPQRRRSMLATADNALLVVAVVVVGIVAISMFHFLFGLIGLAIKIAVVTLVVSLIWRAVNGRRH